MTDVMCTWCKKIIFLSHDGTTWLEPTEDFPLRCAVNPTVSEFGYRVHEPAEPAAGKEGDAMARVEAVYPETTQYKPGEIVQVDHPRYHGTGLYQCEQSAQPRMIGVVLQHGEVRWYEESTVSRLPQPERPEPTGQEMDEFNECLAPLSIERRIFVKSRHIKALNEIDRLKAILARKVQP